MEKMPFHNRYGFIHRLREAWWILTGEWSLHRSWQKGLDEGSRLEYRRLITNKAYIAETKTPSLMKSPDSV